MNDPNFPRQLILARASGLDRDVFAIMNDRGAALVAGITDNDLRPGAQMRAIELGEDTLYWGDLGDLSHRVRGALQDAVEAPDRKAVVNIPETALEEGGSTGDAELDAMLELEPGFYEVLRQCFRAREAKLDRGPRP